MIKEIWECDKCGSPCRVEIDFTNEKMPEHLRDDDRFRNKGCLCKAELFPDWKKISQPGE